MSAYEIFILLGGLFGGLAIVSIASALLDEGSARATAVLLVLTGGAVLMAARTGDGALSIYDIPPAINKLLGLFVT